MTARVLEVDGQIVLDDPDGLALIDVVAKHNCRHTFELHKDAVAHFKNRITELGLASAQVAIVVLNVEDPCGGRMALALMPKSEALWAEIRGRGETPFARGLAERAGIEEVVKNLDPGCWERMRTMETVVMVMDHDTVEVFEI